MNSSAALVTALAALLSLQTAACCRTSSRAGANPAESSARPHPDPRDELEAAERATLEHRDAEALGLVLWCLDNGLRHDRAFVGLWGSVLPALLATLARRYPPAAVAARERVSWLEEDVMTARSHFIDGREADVVSPRMYVEMVHELNLGSRALQFFERLRQLSPRRFEVERSLAALMVADLLEAGADALILEYAEDILARALSIFSRAESVPAEFEIRSAANDCAIVYFVMLNAGSENVAATRDRIVAGLRHPHAYAVLVEYAKKAGADGEVVQLRSKARAELSDDDFKEFETLSQENVTR